jgi:hypothetical protein
LSKKVKGSSRTSRGNTIQRFRKRTISGVVSRNGVGKRLIQCNSNGNCAGTEFPLSMNGSFGILEFSILSSEINESPMESKHLVVKWSLKTEDKIIDTEALIDCGATAIVFIDKDFVHHHELHGKNVKETKE